MNPNLMEQFLGPSNQFFRFNSNDINVLVTPIEKKTCLLTKRNVFTANIESSFEEPTNTRENNNSSTRIRFTNDSANNFSSSKSQLGVNTVISNTNRYNTNESNGLKTSSSSSSLISRKSHNTDVFNDLNISLKQDQSQKIQQSLLHQSNNLSSSSESSTATATTGNVSEDQQQQHTSTSYQGQQHLAISSSASNHSPKSSTGKQQNSTNPSGSLSFGGMASISASNRIPASKSNMASLATSSSSTISHRTQPNSAAAQGAIDEDAFYNAFEAVPKIQLYSAKDLDQHMSQINECLTNLNNDWEKRVDSLKRIRSLVVCINTNMQFEDEFLSGLKNLNLAYTQQIKDLRSQIVREACITITFLSRSFCNRLEHFVEIQLPHLISLIPNSAKIMATSGTTAIRIILEYTHSHRFVPLICAGVHNKTKEIRRHCCEFLDQILRTWDTPHFEKHVVLIQGCIKKGVADADEGARVHSRKAFWSFHAHYPSQADSLLLTMDPASKKHLQPGMQSKGAFGSVKSLKDGSSNGPDLTDSRPPHVLSSKYSSTGVTASSATQGVATHVVGGGMQAATPNSRIKRSTSAVDIKNPRPGISSRTPAQAPIIDSATKSGGGFSSRIPVSSGQKPSNTLNSSRVAQSQPGSRSASPTPKYSYLTHNANSNNINNISGFGLLMASPNTSMNGNMSPRVNGSAYLLRSANNSTLKSKIPTSSRNSSRESSPGRRSNYGSERRVSLNKSGGRRLFARQLTNNSESEQAFANACGKYVSGPRVRRWDDSDEASETSSICSERSFSSSIGGNRVTEDMNEAITCLSSSQWSDRRDGLVNLRNMMQNNRIFTRQEIKRLSEIFSRLFLDQHQKVFTLFLDVLNDFIRTYKRELKEWLYVLLTRLLSKLGSESSSSVYNKLCVCVEGVRSCYDVELQFKVVIQFIRENMGQSSSLKTKVAVLKYLQDLITSMHPSDVITNDDLRYAVGKIVSYTAEPKSVEVRRSSQAALCMLYNLNPNELSVLLNDLPKNIQENALRIIKSQPKSSQDSNCTAVSSPSTNASFTDYKFKTNVYLNDYLGANIQPEDQLQATTSSQLSHVIKDIQNLNITSTYHYLNHKERVSSGGTSGGLLNVKSDNKKLMDTASKDSGVQSNGDVDSDSDGATSSTASSSTAHLPSITYIINTLNSEEANLLEKLKVMKDLTDLIKAGNRPECKWTENFQKILHCLFKNLDMVPTVSDNSPEMAMMMQTLMALRELLQFQYNEFAKYIELTVSKLFALYREQPANELTKLVEEVIVTAARCLPPEPCALILVPYVKEAEYPKNLISIRMLQKTIDQMSPDLCQKLLTLLLDALLIAWDSPHSPVRKAAVFCLVSIYLKVGEPLRIHLSNLSSSKIKLLNVYINRAKDSKDVTLQ